MVAIADLLSIAQLPPGHDPGAGYGVATAARQRWHLGIRHFGLFGGRLAAANDYSPMKKTNASTPGVPTWLPLRETSLPLASWLLPASSCPCPPA